MSLTLQVSHTISQLFSGGMQSVADTFLLSRLSFYSSDVHMQLLFTALSRASVFVNSTYTQNQLKFQLILIQFTFES